ncbi:class I SAM-dependent methyltransferase [Halanaerobaculum tunisiense]
MTHKFNPQKKDKLLSEERYQKLPPKAILQRLSLQPGDRVADIGCGVGFFSLPAAEIVGASGKVYAIDIVEEMLTALHKRAHQEGLENIELVTGEEYSAHLGDDLVDFMLVANVLHEVEKKEEFLRNYLENLNGNGRLAIIEWKKQETKAGPTIEHRISSQEVTTLLEKLGLEVVKEVNLNPGQYAVVGKNN